MSFWGAKFVFDGTPSETYSLYISSPDGGNTRTPGSSSVTLMTESLSRKPRVYLLGVSQGEPLEFDIYFNSPRELTSADLGIIQGWLFGHLEYRKLQIIQSDMFDVYFNCFLTNPRVNKDGNKIVGISAKVICDSPWAWTFERTKSFTYTGDYIDELEVFNNLSENNDYLYPKVEITVSGVGGDITIKNNSDSGRMFTFTGLSSGEVITVDNELKIISSSTGLRRLSNFNLNWFRMVKGLNNLNFNGAISQVDIIYQFARKIGG